MHLRRLPLTALIPAPYNPRVPLEPGSPGYERLARSLREFDLVQPVVWNERTGHVVAGHQRIEVLKRETGATEIDVVVVDLPLEREKALNVALNNAQVGSDWDPAKLVDVLAELADLPDFDATLTGFDDADLNDLLLAPDPEMPDEERDEETAATVRVTIEVPPEDWDDVRPDLDAVIAEHDLAVHVQMPQRK